MFACYFVMLFVVSQKVRSSASPLCKLFADPEAKIISIVFFFLVAPVIVEPFKNAQGVEHGTAKFEAIVKGSPTPKVHILLDGVPFEPEWRIKFEEKVEHDGSVRLTFNKLIMDDEGEYTLVASNPAGKDKCKAFLTVTEGADKHQSGQKAVKVAVGAGIPPTITEKLQDDVRLEMVKLYRARH